MHKKYIEHVGRYDVLSHEEEHELAVRMKNGDSSAREMLIHSNQRFVIKIANQFTNGENLGDLVQSGNVGLIEGIDRYNPDLGYRLTTYANYWILREIYDYYKKNGMIELSAKQKELIKEIGRIIQKRSAISGEGPDLEYIAKILGPEYSVDDVRNAIETDRSTKPISLNKRMGDDSDHELLDSVGIDGTDKIVKDIHYRSLAESVRRAIIGLSTREDIKHVLIAVLFNKKNFKELSDEMGIKAEQVKQKYDIGIRMLKRSSDDIKKVAY